MLNEKSFRTLLELTTYVADESILQANVQTVKEAGSLWYLFWWTP